MKVTSLTTSALAVLATLLIHGSSWAQTTPVDLTEMSMEDLLNISLHAPSSSTEVAGATGWNVGYQFVHAKFDGYLNGTRKLSFEDVLKEYPVVPTVIKQKVHMVVVKRQLSDRSFLTVRVPWLHQETDHIRRMGDPFIIRTEGLGDISTGYSFRPIQSGGKTLWIHAGINLPTGSITAKGDTPRGKDTQVPYTMQLGSGTFDAAPSVAYLIQKEKHQFGASANAIIRIGRNSRDYSLSDRYRASAWVGRALTERLEVTLKLRGNSTTRIDGQDDEVTPTVAPVADTNTYGGKRLDLLGGLRASLQGEQVKHNFRVEVGLPIHQDLHGPQPKLNLECTVYYDAAF